MNINNILETKVYTEGGMPGEDDYLVVLDADMQASITRVIVGHMPMSLIAAWLLAAAEWQKLPPGLLHQACSCATCS